MAPKQKARSGFTYKPRTAAQVKDRASRKTSRFDSIFKPGFDTYRPKPGDNLFRYCPPTWDDSDHYGYTAFVHRNIGPDNSTYLCPRKMLNKPCPICEAAKEALDAGEKEEARGLETGERVICWVIDRDGDDPEKPLLYDTSWTQDRDITSLCVNERTGEILMIDHPDKGFDVTIKRQGTGMKTKYYGYAIAREDSPLHDSEKVQDEILRYIQENPVPDTLNFFEYEYLAGALSGSVAAKDEVEKDVDEEDTVATRRPVREDNHSSNASASRSRRAAVEDEDDTEEEEPAPARRAGRGPRRDQEEEYVEEEAPVRSARARKPVEEEEEVVQPRRGARRPEPVDEEVDEEAEEEAPRRSAAKPASNGRRRVVDEEPEVEDEEPVRRPARPATRVR